MKILSLLLPALLASSAAAQVTVQVGPDPAPLGGPVFASVTNDTDLIMAIGGCPWRILDASGGVVFTPTCIIQEFLVGSLGTINYRWDQVDQGGVQVAPGDYRFEVLTPGGAFDVPFAVAPTGGVTANLHLKGTPAIGTDQIGFGGRPIALSAPQSPQAVYWMAAAFGPGPGIATCGGVLPLANDALLATTLAGGVFTNGIGVLDADGYSEQPLLPIPEQASLVGANLALAFGVLDLSQPCPVRDVSPALPLTIGPGAVPF